MIKILLWLNFILISILYSDNCTSKDVSNLNKKIEGFNVIRESKCIDSETNLISGILITTQNKQSLKKFNRIEFLYRSEQDYADNKPITKKYYQNKNNIKKLSYFDDKKKDFLTSYSDKNVDKTYFYTHHFNKSNNTVFKRQLMFLIKKRNEKSISLKRFFITGELKYDIDYKKGIQKGFYKNGSLKYILKNSVSGLKSETYKSFYPNGNLKVEIDNSWIQDGVTSKEYYSDGKIKRQMEYVNKVYKTSTFDEKSNLTKEVFHKNPSIFLGINGNDKIFDYDILNILNCMRGYSYKNKEKNKLNEAQLYTFGCR